MLPDGLFKEVLVVKRENAVFPPAFSNQVCPPKLLLAMSPPTGIDPFAGLEITASICDRGVLLKA
jgi:hypothetical protein